MNNKKAAIIAIVVVLSIVFLIVGGTYAYWTWVSNTSQKTTVTFASTANLTCTADAGGDITSSTIMLAPAECTNENYAIKRTITTSTVSSMANEVINMDLWLDIKNIDTQLLNSNNFKYAVTTNPNSCTQNVITAGAAFKTKISNNKAYLFTNRQYIGSQNTTYYLYIWLDEAETDSATMNRNFRMIVNGECRDTGVSN